MKLKSTERILFKLVAVTLVFGSLTCVQAQQYVYPAKGQSPDQQKKDENECHGWAVQQSGYDAAKSGQQAAAPAAAAPAPGSGARGAARGAVGGAIIGEVADGDRSNAAAAGAVIGASRARRESRAQQTQAQQQQQAAGPEAYQRARAACLQGRGYSVK